MKYLTLKGREVRLHVRPSQYPIRSKENCRSLGQYHLGQQLRSLYDGIAILEEFQIPDSRLSLDFYIPNRAIAFEFQGEQHDSFNSFFHNTKHDFQRQQERDQSKREWCRLNNIALIEVRDNRISLEALRSLIDE